MVVRLNPLLAALGAAACAAVAGCGGDDGGGSTYVADLQPLNGSGVEGTARVVPVDDELLEVSISAGGLAPDRVHRQGLHGFREEGASARCPDADPEGQLTADEARDVYGDVLVPLAPYPTLGSEGRLDYDLTLTVPLDQLPALEETVVVLQGKAVDDPEGEREEGYLPDLPVACGRLSAGDGG